MASITTSNADARGSTIGAAASQRARRIAWRITAMFALLLGSLLGAFVVWESYFRVETGVRAVEGQLAHLLQVGDTFQLKSQLLSLAQSGIVDRFALRAPNGLAIGGDRREEFPSEALLANEALGFHRADGRVYLTRSFPVGSPPQAAVLAVSKELRFEYFLGLLLLLGAVFFVAQRTMYAALSGFAQELTEPIARLASRMTRAESAAEIAKDEAALRSLRYRELQDAWEAFVAVLVRLGHEEMLRHEAEKDAALAAIAAQVAHDIRSPLTAMNVVLSAMDGIPNEEQDILREAARRIQSIANDLLAKTRSRSIAEELPPRLSPEATVRSLVREKRAQFRARPGISLVEALPALPVPPIRLGHSELERVLSNLVNNAVEAGSGREALTVRIAAGTCAAGVWFEVEDDGPGIRKDLLAKLGHERITHGKGGDAGHGLGLSHAHRVVEAAGGSLHISSQEGVGTRVRFEVPRA